MARPLLLCAAFLLAFLLVPPVSGRPGGRSCHGSFFFSDLSSNNLRTLTLIRDGDLTHSGPSLFSIAASKVSSSGARIFAWIDFRPPANIVEVRLSNLHRQKIQNPNLSYNLDLPYVRTEGITVDRSFYEKPPQKHIVHTWSFSTSDPRPMPWAGVHPRRPDWLHDDDSWRLRMNDVWRMVFGLLFGTVCGMVAAAAMAFAWSLVRRMCMSSHEDDVGILYGYQELPSPKSNEKHDDSGYEKVSTRETTSKMENI